MRGIEGSKGKGALWIIVSKYKNLNQEPAMATGGSLSQPP